MFYNLGARILIMGFELVDAIIEYKKTSKPVPMQIYVA